MRLKLEKSVRLLQKTSRVTAAARNDASYDLKSCDPDKFVFINCEKLQFRFKMKENLN